MHQSLTKGLTLLPRRKTLKLSEYLPYLVNRLGSALVMRFSEDALARHGLSIAMWRVLVALSDNGPRRQIDLSEITSVDVSTLSRLITRLVQMGLATRKRSSRSNREVIVALTPRAERLIGVVPLHGWNAQRSRGYRRPNCRRPRQRFEPYAG